MNDGIELRLEMEEMKPDPVRFPLWVLAPVAVLSSLPFIGIALVFLLAVMALLVVGAVVTTAASR